MSSQTIQVLGTAATLYGLGGALSVLFQARQMHVRGTSGDVSARFFAVYVGGFAVWLVYGISIGSVPVITVHAVGLACGTLTLTVLLSLRHARGDGTASRVPAAGVGPHPHRDAAPRRPRPAHARTPGDTLPRRTNPAIHVAKSRR